MVGREKDKGRGWKRRKKENKEEEEEEKETRHLTTRGAIFESGIVRQRH